MNPEYVHGVNTTFARFLARIALRDSGLVLRDCAIQKDGVKIGLIWPPGYQTFYFPVFYGFFYG
jgi:hypothetical protein